MFIQGRHLIELLQVRERLARGLALIIFRDLRGFINFFHIKCLPVEFMYQAAGLFDKIQTHRLSRQQ